jgi:hypothetical protein
VPGVPVAFFCEHEPSRSRVLALVKRSDCVPLLQPVLACAENNVAALVATSLNEAARQGPEPAVEVTAERVARLLPDAEAVCYRAALRRTLACSWPVAAADWTPSDVLADHRDVPGYASERTGAQTRDAPTDDGTEILVRIVSRCELHIRDRQRLLAAARAEGWEPDQYAADALGDLLGAAMWFADGSINVPGVEVVNGNAEGEYLAGGPVEVEPADPEDERYPDFGALFPLAEVTGAGWRLTPRTADVLYAALIGLADQAYDDVEDHADDPVDPDGGGWSVFDRLPPPTWRRGARWRCEVARAADDLADDLAAGRLPIARCNAEEVCLHLAVEDADAYIDDLVDGTSRHEHLPEHPDDYNWERCAERLFQDPDLLLLAAEWADFAGEREPGAVKTGAAHAPPDWFGPFDRAKARDPRRGFRRSVLTPFTG